VDFCIFLLRLHSFALFLPCSSPNFFFVCNVLYFLSILSFVGHFSLSAAVSSLLVTSVPNSFYTFPAFLLLSSCFCYFPPFSLFGLRRHLKSVASVSSLVMYHRGPHPLLHFLTNVKYDLTGTRGEVLLGVAQLCFESLIECETLDTELSSRMIIQCVAEVASH
jgi:hypothetical protein